ncbi:MAG TPA: hypothetical protein H9745_07115 [Candidatus Agathobaculum stercoravium]|nr:hypothetical protein [Candidatus Agathobaculum stercoravium]
MKREIISVLLAGVLCAFPAVPAGAAGEAAAPAAQEEQAGPAEPAVREMGLRAVASAVQENNPTVQALRENAESIEESGALAGTSGGSGSVSPIDILNAQIQGLEQAMQGLDTESDLYKTYAVQKSLLEAQVEELEGSLSSSMAQGEMALLQLGDAAYQVRRQADNIEGQLAQTAQTLLITIQNLKYNRGQLERQLASLDRTIDVAEVQLSIGTISQYQMDLYRNQRDNLARTIDTLQTQCESLGSSIALLCGYDADTVVMPSTLAPVYDSQLREMSYEDDLELAKQNSFSIWQKRSELRQAQNAYDEDISGTDYAVQSAKDALAAEQQAVESSFGTIFQGVADSRAALDAARTAEQQAELDFRTSQVQYSRGMISELAYRQAQDTLENAKDAVEIAQLNLTSAYNQYEWAKQGVMTTAA